MLLRRFGIQNTEKNSIECKDCGEKDLISETHNSQVNSLSYF